jgi:hypothetical protein
VGTGMLAGAGTFASVSAGAEVGSTFSASGSATLSFVVNSTGASISPWLGGMDYCARCMQVVCGRISRSALLPSSQRLQFQAFTLLCSVVT